MKLSKLLLPLMAICLGFTTVVSAADSNVSPESKDDKVSYTIGVDLGQNFKRQGININAEMVTQGIIDSFSGAELKMTKKEMEEALIGFQKELISERAEEHKMLSEGNKEKGEAFLKENKQKPGVVALPSGLQYKIINPGSGTKPTLNDQVQVNYEGKLINGEVFDSSYARKQPATFKLTDVIPGWSEALQMMKPGATWELFIPPKLAYGEHGLGGPIGPNETLIFKVELISVSKVKNHKNNG